jgi:Uma2 family endonuclease
MTQPSRPALSLSAEDLARLPERPRAELVDGALLYKASPSFEHGNAQGGLTTSLRSLFGHGGGSGRSGPGGWWFGSEVEVEYAGPPRAQVYLHDLAGWRRIEGRARPTGRPVRLRPDWACEVLSPTTMRIDQVQKLRTLRAAGVPHYWLVDPAEGVLTVYRLVGSDYVLALTAGRGERVQPEPFEAVEFGVDELLGED